MDNMIELYKSQLKLENCMFSLVEHEDAIVAIVYRVTNPNGEQYILKICSRSQDYLREKYFLNYFKDILPIAQIINAVEPATNVHGAILMQYLPGNVLQASELTEGLAYEIGVILASIHLNGTKYYGDLIDQNSLSSDPKKHLTFKFQEGLMECENNLPQALLDQCHKYYEAHINLLDSVDGPCIIHRDFRPGNIIVICV